jgi:DinB family protein
MRTHYLLATLTLLAGVSVAAQQPDRNDAAAALRQGFDEVSGWVTKASDLVPADKYAYKPAATVRTFGQLIGHIADAHNYYCARAAGRQVEWSDAIEKGSQDKAVLVRKLKESVTACGSAYSGGGAAGPLLANVAHSSLHYGNIITYMRMLALVPPSS